MPPPSVSLGNDHYPSDKEILEILKQKTDRICLVDGTKRVLALGDIRTLNIFMLGYISCFLPFDLKLWQDCITARLPQKILDMNIEAFEMGRKETSNVHI
jgi:indolepyruvate ferredoxin oxidoreductase beta subunit